MRVSSIGCREGSPPVGWVCRVLVVSVLKPDSERRRRNAPTFEWVVLPAEGRRGRAPALPECPVGRWSAAVRRKWNARWRTPQATQWDQSGVSLERWLLLEELVWRDPGRAFRYAAELRAIEDLHGLTPKAMLGLRWKVASVPNVSAAVGRVREAELVGSRPKGNASRLVWLEWAVLCGADRDVVGLWSRDRLRDEFGEGVPVSGGSGSNVSVLDRFRQG